MTGAKTNERPGTRAKIRHARFSATKARAVLDLIRNLPADEAADVLRFSERGASEAIARCLHSAVSNAQHNDELDGDTLYVSACYADEGPTLKRWRPRARGRATRIRKRTCHITIIVSPMPPEMAARVEARQVASGTTPAGRRGRRAQESRRARVARSRGEAVATEPEDEEPTTGEPTDEMVEDAEAELADAEVETPEDEVTEAEAETDDEDEDEADEPEAEADDDTSDEAPADDEDDDADQEKK
jgi:large subunit ribosomal protein L22